MVKVKNMNQISMIQVRRELGIGLQDKLLLFNFGGQVNLDGCVFA